MKKLSFLFALFLSASMIAFAADEVVYELNYVNAEGGGNGYAEVYNVTVNGIAWSVPGNTQMDPTRIGGKSLSGVDRVLYSQTAINHDITKVIIDHGTASGITINSVTLTVYSSAANAASGSNPLYTVSGGTFAANASMIFNRPEDADWYGCYYRIVYNVTVTGSSNKFFQFKSAYFYAESDEEDEWYQLVGNGDADHGAWCGGLSWQDGESLVDYEIEYTNLPAGNYKFKLKWPGTWDGELNYSHVLARCRSKVTGYDGGDVNFVMQQAGRVKIEVRSDDGINDSIYIEGDMFDSATDTPDPVEWQLVGNGDDEHGAWCGGANWTSSVALEDDEIAYTNLPAGDYQFKLKAPDSWEVQLNYSHVMAECLNLVQPESAGVTTGNVCFVMEEVGDVRIEVRHFDEGDSIFIEGDMKLNSEIIVVDMGPIVETYFGTLPEWAQETESYAEWNELAQTVYVHINQDKNAQWLAQVKIDPNVVIDANKAYDVTFKLYPYQSVNGVTFKYQPYDNDDVAMIYQEGINLTAAYEYTFTKTNVAGVEGVNTMIFDFGFASANSVVAIYGIEVKETEETGTPDMGWSIAGNGNNCNLNDGDGVDRGTWCNGECWQGVALTDNAIDFTDLPVAAGYQFKLMKNNWSNELNYGHVMAECLNYVRTDDNNNVCFIMAQIGDVHIEARHFAASDSIYISGDMLANTDMGPLAEAWFADSDTRNNTVAWDPIRNYVYTIIDGDKTAQWTAIIKLFSGVTFEAGKRYDVSFKLVADKDVSNITFKLHDKDAQSIDFIPGMIEEMQSINITGYNEYTYAKYSVQGTEGDNLLVFDFGFALDATTIIIYDIEIAEAPERLFIAGNGQDDPNGVWCDGKNWDPAGTVLMNDSIHYDNLQPGIVYAFKVTDGAWGYGEMNYDYVLAECKNNFVYTLSAHDYGNIQFQMAAAGAVDIVVKGDSIGVYGNFANPDAIVIDTYTMVGSKDIFGGDEDYAVLEANDMILQQDGSYKLELQNISLYVDERYVMKIFGNYSAMVYEYPEAGYYYYYDPQESGVYDITFWFYPENDEGYKFDSQFVIKSIFTAVDELNAEQAARKLIRDGQLFIVLPDGSRYTATGLRVE